MCLPPVTSEILAETSEAKVFKADAKELLRASITPDESSFTIRWPKAIQAHLPLDKRINVMFEGIPGVQLSPLYLLELPVALFLGWYYWAHFRLSLLAPGFALYFFREVYGMSLSLHRYFSHTGYKCSRLTQFGVWWVLPQLVRPSPWRATRRCRSARRCGRRRR